MSERNFGEVPGRVRLFSAKGNKLTSEKPTSLAPVTCIRIPSVVNSPLMYQKGMGLNELEDS